MLPGKLCAVLLVVLTTFYSKATIVEVDALISTVGKTTFEEAVVIVNSNLADTIEVHIVLDYAPASKITFTSSCVVVGTAPIHCGILGNNALLTNSNVIQINSGNTVEFKGFKFSEWTGNGAFINVQSSAVCKIEKCTFKNINVGSGQGGAVHTAGGAVTINQVGFTDCSSPAGGALNFLLNANFTVENASFHNCNSTTSGGALFLEDCIGSIQHCKFYDCDALSNGGAIYVQGTSGDVKVGASLFHSTCSASGFGPNIVNTGTGVLSSDGYNALFFQSGDDVGFSLGLDYSSISNFGLRNSVVIDGYGMEWMPIVDGTVGFLNLVPFSFTTSSFDLRRAPRGMEFGREPGACEYTPARVTNYNSTGVGSLDNAISLSQSTTTDVLIEFDIPTPSSALTPITAISYSASPGRIYIDGFTQPNSKTPGPYTTAGNLARAYVPIILWGFGSGSIIESLSAEMTISGLTFMSANNGVALSANNCHVFGNYFALDSSGLLTSTADLDYGVLLGASGLSGNCEIGGDEYYHRNTFGQCNVAGVSTNASVSDVIIKNNLFGLIGDGSAAHPNAPLTEGIGISGSFGAVVEQNHFCAYSEGIHISNNSEDVEILLNTIGLNAKGDLAIGNAKGIFIENCGTQKVNVGKKDNGNIISGNNGVTAIGVNVVSSHNVDIANNYIGLGKDLQTNYGNTIGVEFENCLGGQVGASNFDLINFFTGNTIGLYLVSCESIGVYGNAFGGDTTGAVNPSIGNVDAIRIETSKRIVVGSDNSTNYIINSSDNGVYLEDSDSCDIFTNIIGVDFASAAPAPNLGSGILISGGSEDNNVGGNTAAEANTISNNGIGIEIIGSSNNTVKGNTIEDNTNQGINISSSGTIGNKIENNIIKNNGSEAILLGTGVHSNAPTPIVDLAEDCNGTLFIQVSLNGYTGTAGLFEIYRIPDGDPIDATGGEGNEPVFTITETALTSSFTDIYTIPGSIFEPDDHVSVIFTNTQGSSSQLALSYLVDTSAKVTPNTQTDASCFGALDGSIFQILNSGPSPVLFDWQNAGLTVATTLNLTGVGQGNYDFIYTDVLGCADTIQYVLAEPLELAASIIFSNAVSCYNGNDGALDVNITSGIYSPFQISFDGGGTYTSFSSGTQHLQSGFSPGTYNLEVLDADGCSFTSNVSFTNPTEIIGNLSTVPVSCYGLSDGVVSASPTNGAGGYTFMWYDDALLTNNVSSVNSANGPAGWYYLVISDANGCQVVDSIEILEPSNISISTSPASVLCNGDNTGAITTLISGGNGGYISDWDYNGVGSDPASIVGLFAGVYNLSVTDLNGCIMSHSETVTEPSLFSVFVDLINDESCSSLNDGAVYLTPSGGIGGYTFKWALGATGFISTEDSLNMTPGNYDIVGMDSNGCLDTINVTVNPATAISVSAGLDSTICSNQNFVVNGTSSGTSWGWSSPDGSGSFVNPSTLSTAYNTSGLDAGLTINLVLSTSAAGCPSVTDTLKLTIEALPNAGIDTAVQLCQDGSTQALSVYTTVPGGYWYDPNGLPGFNGGTSNLILDNTLPVGTYDFFYIMPPLSAACDNDSAVVTVNLNSLPIVFAGNDTSICSGQSYVHNGTTSGIGLTWDSGLLNGASLSPLVTTTYVATGISVAGCSGTDDIIVSVVTTPVISASSGGIDPNCLGGSDGEISVLPTATNYLYSIDNGATFNASSLFTGLTSGSYNIQIQDGTFACLSAVYPIVLNPGAQVIMSSIYTSPSCSDSNDGDITIAISGGTAPIESSVFDGTDFGTGNIGTPYTHSGLSANTYYLLAQDANGCISLPDTIIMTGPDPITYDLAISEPCGGTGGSIGYLNAQGGTGSYQYSSSGGVSYQVGVDFLNMLVGTYQMMIQDANGCTQDSLVTLTNLGSAVAPIINGTGDLCEGDSLSAISSIGVIEWYDSFGSLLGSGKNFNGYGSIANGDYIYAAVYDGNCLSNFDSVMLNVTTNTLVLSEDEIICEGEQTTIEASFASGIFSWVYDMTISDTSLLITTVNPVNVVTYYEAFLTDGLCVFKDGITITIDINNLDCGNQVNNAFSPNDDGVNDTWYIEALEGNSQNKVTIFNRWGDEIKSINNYNNIDIVWDGKSNNGDDLPKTTYYYVIEMQDSDSKLSGWIQITK